MINTLAWSDGKTATRVVYIMDAVFNKLAETPTSIRGDLEVRPNNRQISAFQQAIEAEHSQKAAATAHFWRMNNPWSWAKRTLPQFTEPEMSYFIALKDVFLHYS